MARMFNTLGVVLYCLLGACPVFVASTGHQFFQRLSGVHVHIGHQLLPVPFSSVPERSGFSSIPSLVVCSEYQLMIKSHCPGPAWGILGMRLASTYQL